MRNARSVLFYQAVVPDGTKYIGTLVTRIYLPIGRACYNATKVPRSIRCDSTMHKDGNRDAPPRARSAVYLSSPGPVASEDWSGIQRAGSKFLGFGVIICHVRTSTHGIDGREGGKRNSAPRTARGRVREASLSSTLPRRARSRRFGMVLVSSIMMMMGMGKKEKSSVFWLTGLFMDMYL